MFVAGPLILHDNVRPDFELFPKLKEHMRVRRVSSLEELCTDDSRAIRHMNKNGALDGIIMLPKRWNSIIETQGGYIEGL